MAHSEIQKLWEKFKTGWSQSLVLSFPCRKTILVLLVKNYTKTDIKLSRPVEFCLFSWHCFINFVRDCLSKYLTRPSLLQTSGLWSLLHLQSLSQSFNVNITWAHCIKVLNWTFFVNTIFPVWFMSKSVIRKLSTLAGVFSIELSSRVKILIFSVTWIIMESVNRKSFRQ